MKPTRRALFTNSLAALAAAPAPDYCRRLVRSNDELVDRILRNDAGIAHGRGARLGRGQNLQALVAAYCAPESAHHRSASLVPLMLQAAHAFVAAQNPDGTIDAGNLASPPDTAFVVEGLATALAVLRPMPESRLAEVKETLGKFLLAAGEALVTGGVHTPNHRWVICSALARLHSLFPAARYVSRIDDWLGEGLYMDADGQFAERSTGIYSRVTCNCLVTMARLLKRPALLEPVRRNLEMTLYYIHPEGELESVASRRQDQGMVLRVANYYLQYRYLAILDRNPAFAAVAGLIESQPGERLIEGMNPVINFLEEPLLRKPLPSGGRIPSDYARVFPASGIARIRRGAVSATVYGGSDWPMGVASGLAANPTFFSFRKGAAILDSVRMAANFFSQGVFRSEGLRAEENRYTLHQRFEVPYYQPLPREHRNPRGDYALTPARDFRFWSKLDFPRRPMSNIQTLDQKVVVVERQGAFELHFEITGHERVPVTVELAFRPGGQLHGALQEVVARGGDRAYLLREGAGQYRAGGDAIEFGPGEGAHLWFNLAGPSYTAHGAPLVTPGTRVYLTGYTPFRRVLTIRAI